MRKRIRAHLRRLSGFQAEALVIHHEDQAVAPHGRARRREVQRHDLDAFEMDVLPDIELGPVRDRKDADAFALGLVRVVEVPQFGALLLRVPAVIATPEAEDALLRATFFLVTARAAEGGVETKLIERLLESFSLPHIRMQRPMVERVDAFLHRLRIVIDGINSMAASLAALSRSAYHVAKLPGRIHVQQRKRRAGRIERLLGQVQHHGAVLADRVQHDRSLNLGHDFAQDVNTLGLEALEVSELASRCGIHRDLLHAIATVMGRSLSSKRTGPRNQVRC